MYDIFVKLLERFGKTTADVCRETGISQSTISNWKKRKNILSPALLQKIADYFGVSLDFMMGAEKESTTIGTDLDNAYSIFDQQDIIHISDEAKEVALMYDKLPADVQKSIRTLLKYREQRP